MKNIVIASLLLLWFNDSFSQSFKAKSSSITFKGDAIIAEEKRIEQEINKNQELQKLTIQNLGITYEQIPKYYALIIGVSEYLNTSIDLPNLDNPTKDSNELYSVLSESYTFDSANINLLINPSKKEIISAFEYLAEIVTERDNVLVFYAGHGIWDKKKDFGYWLPSDADIKDKSTWLPNSTLKDYLGAIKSKHTLLIADACFSGSIFKFRSADPGQLLLKFNQIYRDKSRRAITSGNLTTVPDKSIFLEQLVKALKVNEDTFLQSRLLYSRIYEPVVNNSINEPQSGIIVGVGDEGGDFIFIKKN